MRPHLLFGSLALASALTGCATTRFHERERLADRAAAFDRDRQLAYLRDKIEAAREGVRRVRRLGGGRLRV